MGDLKKKLQIAEEKIVSAENRQHKMNREMIDLKKKLQINKEKIVRLSAAERYRPYGFAA